MLPCYGTIHHRQLYRVRVTEPRSGGSSPMAGPCL